MWGVCVWPRYGHLTWEWEHRLRGFLHPGLFAAVFALLRLFHADSPLAIVRDYSPLRPKSTPILQAVAAGPVAPRGGSDTACGGCACVACGVQIVGPRVLQGLMQAVGDWGAYALARSFFGPRTAAWAVRTPAYPPHLSNALALGVASASHAAPLPPCMHGW